MSVCLAKSMLQLYHLNDQDQHYPEIMVTTEKTPYYHIRALTISYAVSNTIIDILGPNPDPGAFFSKT